ncbi:MAG: hypothetical protein PHY92_08770 [Alphaproteobacteria bacterium]|nr:hypothetical protein [Alphaproteobacteria bacterium]
MREENYNDFFVSTNVYLHFIMFESSVSFLNPAASGNDRNSFVDFALLVMARALSLWGNDARLTVAAKKLGGGKEISQYSLREIIEERGLVVPCVNGPSPETPYKLGISEAGRDLLNQIMARTSASESAVIQGSIGLALIIAQAFEGEMKVEVSRDGVAIDPSMRPASVFYGQERNQLSIPGQH